MNTKRTLNAEFEPETRFEVPPQPPAPFRADLVGDLERLKNRLLKTALATAGPGLNVPLRRAANDAAALVWLQPFPLLLLPELFAEKARLAADQARRQQRVTSRSRAMFAEAA